MPALFSFDAVTVRFDGAAVLDRVTAEVAVGGVTVLWGPSGSGKSTLLRLCNRLLVPTSGTVRLGGVDLADLDPLALRRRVGMVFQRPTPFPGTVADNLRVAAPELDEQPARRLLERVALGAELLERDALTLSGGEAQRVCLARTWATGCEVLLADECTSSLDPDAAAVIESSARAWAHEGNTVVWVTHDAAQRARMADRSLRIEGGRVVG